MIKKMDELIAHLKSSGFVFQGSEIYGGLANSWDYGPLGAQMKMNVKNLWWDFFVKFNPYNMGLDSSIILNNNVWKASGHIDGFNDPLIDCKNCKSRWRADKLIEEKYPDVNAGKMTNQEIEDFIKEKNITCPKCGKCDFTQIRNFGLMFKTNQGVIEDENSVVYLRPETAQGIFINFKNAQRALRKKLPFGIGQIGKSFRNEITPGNFIFRTREFEQMELEFFFNPNDGNDWFNYWINQVEKFLTEKIGINKENYRLRKHDKEELAHYSSQTTDVEFNFPFGWGELWGIADRGNFDLTQHAKHSGADLYYLDPVTNEKILPNVIEPSVGLERMMLAIMSQAYEVETLEDGTERVVMRLNKQIAPYLVAVMPLQKKIGDGAYKVYEDLLASGIAATYDETGNVGKRYRRQDAIGTPYVITYDFDSETDGMVTIRDRDTMAQERIKISDLNDYLINNQKK
ncbi:glycine--tRNA ligase [Mesoplasma lactucae]|uniref:Glycine--tRNA ligase n=1 Tax=Mesoplasma lactucae ATCC 49193 TaxID=81460 RepID=A0A291IRF0_9MOLU|nr:glycine--tRNA ligase [Mesoplasma lactucae]ATG97353.1 glycine--tRNA ligase [Mesoplasma lactucae ATCC 49193]ATZ20195.1 glycyl-tRNA synthetase [Mesoplasma lactucae ATCC 49193]MCL8216944.1 Glycine--tRNA ligase [Mesoplasma lactucae ATCC 49193]